METATPETNNAPSQASIDSKIMTDLGTLNEKLALCDALLHPTDGSPAPSLKNNETLLAVIGFLEACAPRMIELVEAAAQGALSEEVLMECLGTNDRLTKMLADIDTYSFTETPASTTAASAPPPKASLEETMDDLLLDDTPAAPAPTGGKTTGEEEISVDPFGSDVLTPAPLATAEGDASDSKMPAAAEATETSAAGAKSDDFDAFLEERTSS